MSRLEEIEKLLANAYAKEIASHLWEVTQKKCYGCIVDHPSQRHHDVCLMMEEEERIDVCFEDALRLVDHDRATTDWKKSIEHLNITGHEILKFDCIHWRETVWITDEWKKRMKKLILDL